MTVKPLSEEETRAFFTDKGYLTYTERLKELFAELLSEWNVYDDGAGDDVVMVKKIEELFGPLVPK